MWVSNSATERQTRVFMPASSRTILISGMIAADSRQGGATWAVLQYVLGLRRLGHDVHLVEPIPPRCVHPESASLGESTNAAYFREVAAAFGLGSDMTLLREDTRE